MAPGDDSRDFNLRITEDPEDQHSLIWEEVLDSLSPVKTVVKNSIIAEILLGKQSNKEIAFSHTLSPGRISQIRREVIEQDYLDKNGKPTEKGKLFLEERNEP